MGCSSAYAGQYTLTYDFAGDLSGWSGYVEPGYVLCGRGATAGCPDVSTNRILAQPGAGQAVWSQGRWEWTAPPGTQIVGGSLAYRTRMRHSQFYARVKMRADGVTWDAAPTLVNEQQTTALTDHVIPLAGGFRQVGVALYAHPAVAGLVTNPWDDYVTLVRMVVTVQDATPPALIWVDGGGLLDGAWHRGDVCATFGLGDRESGAGAVWLASGAASAVWNATPTGSQYQPAAAYGQPTLCLGAAALGDGIHAGAAGGLDASGEQAAQMPFTVRIDATPPSARLLAPGAVASDARPGVELEVGDASSGISSVLAQIDGVTVPLDLAGARASGRPGSRLAYGAHTLAWSIVDAAGNRTDGSARFDVPDTEPPSFGAPEAAERRIARLRRGAERSGRRARRRLRPRSGHGRADARRRARRSRLARRGRGARRGRRSARSRASITSSSRPPIAPATRGVSPGTSPSPAAPAHRAAALPRVAAPPLAARRERHPERPGRPLVPAPPRCAP